MERYHILVLDENQFALRDLLSILKAQNHKVYPASTFDKVFSILETHLIHLFFCNVHYEDGHVFKQLPAVQEKHPDIEIITMGTGQDVNNVLKSFRSGASDFLLKPFNKEEVLAAIERSACNNKLSTNKICTSNQWSLISPGLQHLTGRNFIGRSRKIKEVLRLAFLVAAEPDLNILITGENGTGKEILARIIHHTSKRRSQRFCPINCAAVPDTLVESEFFGHKKGTFTGALEDKKGCFEQAHNGTLFLDEISEMPYGLQAKLLRAIEEKKIKPLGSNKELHCNFRIVSATNAKPDRLLEAKKLRIDLFHRLNTFNLHIPPLRERKEDVTPLICHFVNQITERRNEDRKWISPEVFRKMKKYPFPGNVRELRNIVERAMLIAGDGPLLPDHFQTPVPKNSKANHPPQSPTLNIEENEKTLIANALIKCHHNNTHAAKMLGISRDTLIRKKKKYNIHSGEQTVQKPPTSS